MGSAGEDLEGQLPAASGDEGEPEPSQHVDHRQLVEAAHPDRPEAHVGDQLLDERTGVTVGPAPEQVGRRAVEVGAPRSSPNRPS